MNRTQFGRVPGANLQTLRVSAAKELLERSNASIQVVSTKIGYEDIGFFRNLFKRHTGMTPGEYRDKFSQMSGSEAIAVRARAISARVSGSPLLALHLPSSRTQRPL
jgi:AraC-like DNA-binding protein